MWTHAQANTSSVQNKIAAARFRAKALSDIRAFFLKRDVLEVETPLLSRDASHDFHIDLFSVPTENSVRFLQTSPEPHMKRLLARGYPDIFQISKAFRMGESGKKHNPEFTMLEWYRLGFTLSEMIEEAVELCQLVTGVAGRLPTEFVSYGDAFSKATGFDPFSSHRDQLVEHPAFAGRGLKTGDFPEGSDALNFLMSEVVEPALNPSFLTVIHSFPLMLSSQALPDPANPLASLRFEIFGDGMELGNGYQELRDITEYHRRFEAENQRRESAGKPVPPLDEGWFRDVTPELPACSGVAIGLDRLILMGLNTDRLEDLLEFSWEKS